MAFGGGGAPLTKHPWSGLEQPCRFARALEECIFLTDPVW
jgi:hypothetical protein